MFRHELKYIISAASARAVRSRLENICASDSNADSSGRYRVSSLYFDDFCNSALEDNLSGQLARKKFRIRIYNGDTALIRLERKTKCNGGCQKDTAVLSRDEYDRILAGDISFLCGTQNPVLKDFYMMGKMRLLRPKVIVEYVREAFVYDPGTVRITFDRHIKHSLNNMDLFNHHAIYAPALQTDSIILEVKYTGFLPWHIRDMVQNADGLRQSASKYTMCRMAL